MPYDRAKKKLTNAPPLLNEMLQMLVLLHLRGVSLLDSLLVSFSSCCHSGTQRVTRPVLLQLLGELLLDRSNVKVMMRYVSDSKNLQMMMMLLKDNSRSIQFEAFHVFKVQQALTSLQVGYSL